MLQLLPLSSCDDPISANYNYEAESTANRNADFLADAMNIGCLHSSESTPKRKKEPANLYNFDERYGETLEYLQYQPGGVGGVILDLSDLPIFNKKDQQMNLQFLDAIPMVCPSTVPVR